MADREADRRGFENVAGEYDRARPDYPREAIAWLAAQADLGARSVVIDVGAGTGKLSAQLERLGLDVTAVEPVAAMRAILARRLPKITVLDATADAVPLPDGCAQAVTAGQSYHWFAGPAALAEFHRVLAPGGSLALVWNVRDRTQDVWRRIDAVLGGHRDSAPTYEDGRWRATLEASDLFGAALERRFANPQPVDRDAIVERAASTSCVGALPETDRARLLEQVRAIADAMEPPLVLRYVTEVSVFARRAARVGGVAGSRGRGAGGS